MPKQQQQQQIGWRNAAFKLIFISAITPEIGFLFPGGSGSPAPSFCRYGSLCRYFKEKFETILDRNFPHLPVEYPSPLLASFCPFASIICLNFATFPIFNTRILQFRCDQISGSRNFSYGRRRKDWAKISR